MITIELLLFNTDVEPNWPYGPVHLVDASPKEISEALDIWLDITQCDYWLFWDALLGLPDPTALEACTMNPGDLWHGGLCLGTSGKPMLLDYVLPSWMHTIDAVPSIESTSWRLSLRACLVKSDVLQQIGGPDSGFTSLMGSGLEMGLRMLQQGVFTRHVPSLVKNQSPAIPSSIPFQDNFRIVALRTSLKWAWYAAFRELMNGYISLKQVLMLMNNVVLPPPKQLKFYTHKENPIKKDIYHAKVSVIIPTLDRYPYLHILLEQLSKQTILPSQVLVIDQTKLSQRDYSLQEISPQLPIQVIYQDEPGQCSARNTALYLSTGDFIVFLDDDVEIERDFIEKHLVSLFQFNSDVSAGTVHEPGQIVKNTDSKHILLSSVFPTDNCLIRKEILLTSGLFDLAYDHGIRADGDLGMRLYLNGAMIVQNEQIDILHYRAPRGGLRTYNARKITYASSRTRVTHRQLLNVTELYLALRYYSPRQVNERIWLSILGTFSIRGNIFVRLLKFLFALLMLPNSVWRIHTRLEKARQMFIKYPQIPEL